MINYAAPIYSPNLKPSHVSKLQRAQNQCLRVASGAHAAASMEHLHHESKLMLVGDHLDMLSRQFLAKTLVPDHPLHNVASRQPGPRSLRHTLSSRHLPSVSPFLRGGSLPAASMQDCLSDLHTSAVAVSVNKLDAKPNRVLGTRPPPVDESERALPRPWRSTLCQLRSGFCRSLGSFMAVLNDGDPTYPECGVEPQTTGHLFNCGANPLPCEVVDLWCNPLHAAHSLSLLPSFSHLPSVSAPSSPWLPRPVLRPPPPPPPPPLLPLLPSSIPP